ncbi:prolyl oligopeptidase family serine peptidase [Salinimicrobium sp. GXAS 041]|uniref:carboxylesterase family protein n=1 Tax=Salinimicrobium sp. GXAS 041 TaxID=3400806 RepID=UPI003C71A779
MKEKFSIFSLLFLVVFLSFSASGRAQEREEFQKEQFIQENDTLNYRILFPKNFSEEKEYPLVLFLHGAGERGNDNESQLTHGSDLFLKNAIREDFPAVVIFPQAPKDDYWAKVDVNRDVKPFEFDFMNEEEPTKALHLAMALLNSVATENYINKNRIYVGGLSMGGMGTYEILSRMPETFAAAFAICGGADPAIVKKYPKGFNIWIFHGERDDIVPPEWSKTMARVINSEGGNAKLSLYPNDNHNSWDSAFEEPYLLPWLFSHQKNDY